MTFCSPWATVEEVQGDEACSTRCADIDTALLEEALDAATQILYDLTEHNFPGVCEETVRYCAQPGGRGWVAETPSQGYANTTLVDTNAYARAWACGCGGGRPGCGCSRHAELDIGRSQVREVTSVTINGEVLSPAAYQVHDWRYLVRVDGASWPCCSDLEFSYEYGSAPNPALKRAAMRLACELARDWCSQPCDLPSNMTNLTRQGVTVAVLGAVDATADAPFGIRSIDSAVMAWRYAQSHRGAALSGPHRSQTRRKVTWP